MKCESHNKTVEAIIINAISTHDNDLLLMPHPGSPDPLPVTQQLTGVPKIEEVWYRYIIVLKSPLKWMRNFMSGEPQWPVVDAGGCYTLSWSLSRTMPRISRGRSTGGSQGPFHRYTR